MLTAHQPVLVNEVLEALSVIPSGYYIDGTFGQGGHTAQLVEKLDSNGRILAIDKDPTSKIYFMKRFDNEKKVQFCEGSFSHIQDIAEKNNLIRKVNGILLDLGTSASQLDNPERGFSFLKEGPLDMRMNPAIGKTAAYWISKMSVSEMSFIFKKYGEEKWAKRIAEAIFQARKREKLETTTQLAQIIKAAHPRWPRKIHPATRVFQAIRIYINQEIEELMQCLRQSMEILAPGGRLAVITFHSLEAREIKQFMRHVQDHVKGIAKMRWINTGIKPSAFEITHNPRARSAVLRVMQKIE